MVYGVWVSPAHSRQQNIALDIAMLQYYYYHSSCWSVVVIFIVIVVMAAGDVQSLKLSSLSSSQTCASFCHVSETSSTPSPSSSTFYQFAFIWTCHVIVAGYNNFAPEEDNHAKWWTLRLMHSSHKRLCVCVRHKNEQTTKYGIGMACGIAYESFVPCIQFANVILVTMLHAQRNKCRLNNLLDLTSSAAMSSQLILVVDLFIIGECTVASLSLSLSLDAQ